MIFVSYRRADAGGHAGRLFDRLAHWFDADALFYDLDGIDMGDTFPERIEATLERAAVVLVVIGPDWLAEINKRVSQPGVDFVRREVELALARHQAGKEVVVVPVLLGGAAMPSAHQFHEDLKVVLAPLCALDAHEFRGKQADWENQFVRLRERIAQAPGVPAPRFRTPAGAEQPFHLIDHNVSPYFQDPNHVLASLHEQLTASGSAAVLARAALYGMGGVGKTQLALKYSHEYRDLYAGVWWFRAESDTTLQLDAQDCCQTVGAPIQDGETPSAALKRWLARQTTPWLLVYDNAEEVAALRPHLPQAGPHHLIITSRNAAWGGLAQPVELEVWTPEQGADFLAVRLPGAQGADLLELARDLGGLPLALEQAASYMEETGTPVDRYRTLLAGVDTEGLILDEGRAATGYERSVAATLSLAFDRLSPAAARLLRLCAFAAPEPLPERFFLEAAEHLPEELAKLATDALAWNRVAGQLRRCGLAERLEIPALDRRPGEATGRTEPALVLHRLTQQVVRVRLAQPAEDARNLQAVLRTCCPGEASLPDHWPRFSVLAEHVIQMDRYLQPGWLDTRDHVWLLNQVVNYLWSGPALYAEAISWVRRAWEIAHQELGEEHPDTLASMNNQAVVLHCAGDLAGARVLLEKVLEVHRRVFGEENTGTLQCASSLAKVLRDQGNLSSARKLLEQMLSVCGRVLGEEYPVTLISMAHLASILMDLGDLAGARTLQEKLLGVRRRTLGAEHPDTLSNMDNLAYTLYKQGDLSVARALLEEVLEVRRRVQGENHPQIVTSMNNLGVVLDDVQGNMAGARALLEKVLEVSRRVKGEDHPDTLTSMNNLAVTLYKQGDLASARELQEKVLEVSRRVKGEDHPDTLASMNNLARTLWELSEPAEALRLTQATAEGRARVLGPEHPDATGSQQSAEWMRVRHSARPPDR
jgi:tetratricopeptide (TPR) repeat protein